MRASSNTNLGGYLCSFWPSRIAHVYIALLHNRFFLASDISFSEYVAHRSEAMALSLCVKRDSDCPHALGLPYALLDLSHSLGF